VIPLSLTTSSTQQSRLDLAKLNWKRLHASLVIPPPTDIEQWIGSADLVNADVSEISDAYIALE
jgi:hypothetical protein